MVSEVAAPYGLYYAPDPSVADRLHVGGNVAENSGGVHCLKYGLTVHNVLRIRVVSVEGEVLRSAPAGAGCAGYDPLALFIGSEGRSAWSPKSPAAGARRTGQVVMATFDDVGQSW